MKKLKFSLIILSLLLFISALPLQADVKRETKTKMDFKGTLGAIMKFFGAEKPFRSVEYYQGQLFRSDNVNEKGQVTRSQIIDLDKELFISIDHKDKKYSQMTFEEFRQMMKRTLEDMKKGQEKEKKDEPKVEWDFKVDVKKTGETEMIAGQSAEKVIIKMEVTSRTTQPTTKEGAGQTAQGDLIVTSSNWMVKSLDGQKEIENFHIKFAEKLGLTPEKGGLEQLMRQLGQSHPQLAEAMKKLQQESKNLAGVPVRTHTIYETKTQSTAASEANDEKKGAEIPTSVGGLMKGFGKKLVQTDKSESTANVLMEISDELVSAELISLEASLFEVPANYKLQPNATK